MPLIKFSAVLRKEIHFLVLWMVCAKIEWGACSDMSDASFGTHSEGVLAAFGDFNSDELTDAFVIANRSSLQIYFAYDKEPLLRPSTFVCNFSGLVVTSVVPGDYDGDAFMDVLLTTMTAGTAGDEHQQVRVLWGGQPYFNCTDADIVKVVTVGQPLVIDYNQDMILDLFGVNEKGARAFWIFDNTRALPHEILMSNTSVKPIKVPHSHAFLDVNGDNAADLLVTTNLDVEIWLGSETPGFTYYNCIQLPIGPEGSVFGQALFLDVALTGDFFTILPACFDAECSKSNLLIYEDREDDRNWRNLMVNFNDGRGDTWRLVPPRNETYLDTMTMRSGDFNMDGYPDILLTLCKEKTNDTYVFLLQNKPCNFQGCEFRRTYEVQWDKFTTMGKGTVLATFYDFYMDGILDIIYMKKNLTTNTYTMHAFKNELDYDANFIKVIVLTGLTNKRSPEIYGPFHKKKWTYGTNLPGAKISYSTVSPQGSQRRGVCAQLPQSAYFALQLPYSIFGLDRTPNFVESLMVGLSGYLRTWTQIIPNSQMVVVPKPRDDPTQWRAQLFVTPSKLVWRSVLVLTAVLVLILASVLFLHWRERNDRQDIVEISENTYVRL